METHQSSDTTYSYRVYDYDRKDTRGEFAGTLFRKSDEGTTVPKQDTLSMSTVEWDGTQLILPVSFGPFELDGGCEIIVSHT
ncbi:hypothetical protein RCG22_16960 [Neobacillus sp. OS1-33]|nr:hypothetical protein [Neobacillus sp. OS1-33]WML24570.1 hypothetical protein RCG22_16960 [Neobacillus sp. OS1-33]